MRHKQQVPKMSKVLEVSYVTYVADSIYAYRLQICPPALFLNLAITGATSYHIALWDYGQKTARWPMSDACCKGKGPKYEMPFSSLGIALMSPDL